MLLQIYQRTLQAQGVRGETRVYQTSRVTGAVEASAAQGSHSKKRSAALLLFLPVLFLPVLGHATTITFSGAPTGGGFTGPVTEAGYTYSLYAGALFINTDGNPGNNVEPVFASGSSGTLKIVSATPGTLFDFNGIDVGSAGAGSVTVIGYDMGTLVGTDTFAGANTGLPGTYHTYTSTNLTDLSALYITLPAAPPASETAIDNVVLTVPAAVTPGPSTFAYLATGMAGAFAAARRRFRTA